MSCLPWTTAAGKLQPPRAVRMRADMWLVSSALHVLDADTRCALSLQLLSCGACAEGSTGPAQPACSAMRTAREDPSCTTPQWSHLAGACCNALLAVH